MHVIRPLIDIKAINPNIRQLFVIFLAAYWNLEYSERNWAGYHQNKILYLKGEDLIVTVAQFVDEHGVFVPIFVDGN